MLQLLSRLRADEEGQDLIEYTLLLAFVVFSLTGLFLGLSNSVAGITGLSNSQINAAAAQTS